MPQTTGRKNYIIWEPFLLAAMLALGMMLGTKMKIGTPSTPNSSTSEKRSHHTVEDLLRYIETRYVDEVDGRALTESAIEAILGQLDPHSQYLSAQRRQRIDEEMDGTYFGVGIEKIHHDSLLLITRVSDPSPAFAAGLRPGDRILSVMDSVHLSQGLSQDSLQSLLRSGGDEKIPIRVLNVSGETLDFDLERSDVPIPSVDLSKMINDSIGLIKINRFASTTYKEFMEALETLADQGLDDLILDLRNNPGGYLQETVKILSQLIKDKDELLVFTEGQNSKRSEYKSTGRRFYDLDDIVVLLNEGSASASEILAGALQDLDAGVIVGQRSFGKGLVQEQYDLSNGAAVRLTTARYFTPSGRLIQKDYDRYSGFDDYDTNEDTSSLNALDSSKHFTKKGREVFGGGGVTPDILLKDADSLIHQDRYHLDYYVQLFVAMRFTDLEQHLETQDRTRFLQSFEWPEAQNEPLLGFLRQHWSWDESNDVNQWILRSAKAHFAKMLFNDMSIYWEIMFHEDRGLNKAISLISEDRVEDILLGG